MPFGYASVRAEITKPDSPSCRTGSLCWQPAGITTTLTRTKKRFLIHVYQSADQGLTWEEINETLLFGKEPSLTAMPDGMLVMSAQKGYFGPGSEYKEAINMARSTDGGRTWELYDLPGADYPRNMIVERDGSLLFVRAVKSDWSDSGDGSQNLQLCRSKDGKTWQFSEGAVDWSYAAFGEVSAIRLQDGRLLAALRRQIPKTKGEGFEDTVITESSDDGKTWYLLAPEIYNWV